MTGDTAYVWSAMEHQVVHMGLITFDDGGKVQIEHRPRAESSTKTDRNGVRSRSWGSYDSSFVVV